jgi:CheY-like chemotaxis protein
VVLAVDSERSNLIILCRVFNPDYTFGLATSGTHALRLLKQHQFDTALIDYHMVDMCVIEFLQRLRTMQPLAGRILLADAEDMPQIKTIEDPALFSAVITKPWVPNDIRRWVDNFGVKNTMHHDMNMYFGFGSSTSYVR